MTGQGRHGTKSSGHRGGRRTGPGVVATCEFSLILKFLQSHGAGVNIKGWMDAMKMVQRLYTLRTS